MPDEKTTQRRGGRPAALPIDKLIAILATMDKRNGKPEQSMLELGESAAGGE